MYVLVKFVEDNVYYVCQFKNTKKISNEMYKARWIDGRYYLAKFIARHKSKLTLEQVRKNLESNYPVVVLSPIITEDNFGSNLNLSTLDWNFAAQDLLFASSESVTSSNNNNTSVFTSPSLKNSHTNLAQNEYTCCDGDLESSGNYTMQLNQISQENIDLAPAEATTNKDTTLVNKNIENNEAVENLMFNSTEIICNDEEDEFLLNSINFDLIYEEESNVQVKNNITEMNLPSASTQFEDILEDNENLLSDTCIYEIEIVNENFNELLNNFVPPDQSNSNKLMPVTEEVSGLVGVDCETEEHLGSTSIQFEYDKITTEDDEIAKEIASSNTSIYEFEIVNDDFNELLNNYVSPDPSTSNKLMPVTDEVSDLVEVDCDKGDDARSIEFRSIDEDSNHERSGPSSLVTPTERKKKAVPLRYDRSIVVAPCTDTRTTDVGNLPVPTYEKKKSRKYFCIYCKKLYSKFPQHLQVSHRNEVAVKMYMHLPPKNAERRKIIETIRRRGDFEYNTSGNCSELLVARRSHSNFPKTSKNYLPCPYCTAFFCKSTLRLHVKHCATVVRKGERNIQVMSRIILNNVHPTASQLLKKNIFSILRNDDCVTIIRYDRLAITYGNFLCSKYSSQHHQDMIRSKLRTIGRLLIAARSLDSTITDFASLLTPEKFDITVAAIKQVGGLNDAQTSYKSPTTVLNLATICKHASQVWKTTCIKDSNHELKQKVEDFITLFNVAFPAELGKTATENQVQFQRQKVVELPRKEDITKLVVFLRINRRLWFSKIQSGNEINLRYALKQLASFTLVSMMVFNRRRPGELERITIDDFRSLKSADAVSAVSGHLKNDEERDMAKRYKRFEIRGKLNRTVPVLVDFEIEECINLIIARREEVGIPSKNPYVFACHSTDHRNRYLRAYFLLRSYANLCGAAKPNLLKATELRKQIATECALKDLSENVIHDVANFMGHAINIHNNIYRMPVDKRDIVRMSKILEMIQGEDENMNDGHENVNDGDENVNDGDENVNDDVENVNDVDENVNPQQENSQNQNDDNDDNYDFTYQPPDELHLTDTDSSSSEDKIEYSKKKKKGRHTKGLQRICGSKKPWSAKEQRAAINYFGKYLVKNKLPSVSVLCQELKLIVELKERSPTSVKSWLQNELVKRKTTLSDDNNPNKRKFRWTSEMKDRLNIVFADHLEDGTLPSKPECMIAIDNHVEFENLTPAALKTAVANEQKRKSKNKSSHPANRRLFVW